MEISGGQVSGGGQMTYIRHTLAIDRQENGVMDLDDHLRSRAPL